ncbi:O-antigen ligase family protein [Rubritalea sp.]|uniref:O-antigen ligase family protein n=1 Tax=Rubritalea sp. TaxID=2109375 RepID=UPI003242012D
MALYFGGRAWFSPVWDIAKEDVLLLCMGLIVYWGFRSVKMTGSALTVIAGFILVNGIYFCVQKAGGDLWLPLDGVSQLAQSTPNFGLFQDYGAMGNAMAVVGMSFLSWAVLAQDLKVRGKYLLGVLGCVALILAFFSGSRSTVFSLIVAGGLMLLVLWLRAGVFDETAKKRMRLLVVLGGACAAVLVGALSLRTFAERDNKVVSTGVVTESNIRASYWGMAVDQWREAPLVGEGARAYSFKLVDFWEDSLASSDATPEFVHNEYLQVLADYGALGLFLLLVVLGLHWSAALRSVLLADKIFSVRWMSLAGLLGITVIMVHSFTDFPLRLPFNMFLAAVCLGWCVSGEEKGERRKRIEARKSTSLDDKPTKKRREERDSETGGGKRIKDKGLAAIMILLSAGMLLFAGREVWAAAPLVLENQDREGRAGAANGGEALLEAYTLANGRSPDFRRSQRLAKIYHSRYGRGDEAAFSRAEEFYKESLLRHPYNSAPLLNLANLYRDAEMYANAEKYYDLAEPYVASRDWHFKYYTHRAWMMIAQAENAYRNKEFIAADQYLIGAGSLVKQGSSASKPRLNIERDCHVSRVRMAVARGAYDAATDLWLETRKQVKPWVINDKEARVYRALGEVYYAAALREWKTREPELAKTLFLKSKKLYGLDKRVHGNKGGTQRDANVANIEKYLEVLEMGGF